MKPIRANLHPSVIARASMAAFWLLVLVLSFLTAGARPEPESPAQPTKIVGPRECAECHEAENRTWLETAHQTSFKTLSRSKEARAIAKELGIRRVKRDERCIRCHFTEQGETDQKLKVIGGVSCESCHGAGQEWIDIHGDFGAASAEEESSEHREERLARSIELGLRGPNNVATLIESCYACHLVTDDELVAAGHPRDGAFDPWTATQGEVRHNFVRGKGDNVPASESRKRLIHWTGRLFELAKLFETVAAQGQSPNPAFSVRAMDVLYALPDSTPDFTWADCVVRAKDWQTFSGNQLRELAEELRAEAHALQAREDSLPPVPEGKK